MADKETILIPELGPFKFETEMTTDLSYVMRLTQRLTGQMREYETQLVIRALEAAGYEVRKKEP